MVFDNLNFLNAYENVHGSLCVVHIPHGREMNLLMQRQLKNQFVLSGKFSISQRVFTLPWLLTLTTAKISEFFQMTEVNNKSMTFECMDWYGTEQKNVNVNYANVNVVFTYSLFESFPSILYSTYMYEIILNFYFPTVFLSSCGRFPFSILNLVYEGKAERFVYIATDSYCMN